MPKKEISAAEASRRLRVQLSFVYMLIWSGKLAARKVNKRWMVSEEAVEARREGRVG